MSMTWGKKKKGESVRRQYAREGNTSWGGLGGLTQAQQAQGIKGTESLICLVCREQG